MTVTTCICAAASPVERPLGAGLPTRAMEEGTCTGHTVEAGTVLQQLGDRIHPAPARPELRRGRHGTYQVQRFNRMAQGTSSGKLLTAM